ncbi:MAG: hypothetical protein GY757_41745, partial [bacterium]|nr:hypothetical protein [bacterium]
MKRILIIRSAPLEIFNRILMQVKKQYARADFTVLAQQGILEKIETGETDLLEIPDGMFKCRRLEKRIISAIKKKKNELFVIPVNNSQFEGYGEILKLALTCKIKNLRMITPDLKTR